MADLVEAGRRRRGSRPGSGLPRLMAAGIVLILMTLGSTRASAQQFNSDNWWVLPHTTGMGVISAGQYFSSVYLGYGFLPGWEVDAAATLYEAKDSNSTAHYSTTFFVKRLIVQDAALTQGVAIMGGLGQGPGYLESGLLLRDFKNYWLAVPVTLSLLGNALSWDLMPGGTWNIDYEQDGGNATAFTYSSRLAIYRIIPQSAIVMEVFGAAGQAEAPAQYRAGVRWESEHVVAALTYGRQFNGGDGSGIELGFMFLTPPFD